MARRSAAFQRIILVLAALAALGAAAWAAMQVFEPAPIPPIAPPKTRVNFDTRKDIRNNPLFQSLQGFVTGVIEPGALGKANPFVGPDATKNMAGTSGVSGLGVVEEMRLSGSGVIGLSQAPDGSMLVLLEGKNGADAVYEVRRYRTDGVVDSPVSWTLSGGVNGENSMLVPAAFAQSSAGTVWFVSTAGRVAHADPGSTPIWSPDPLVPLNGTPIMRIDGADRLWVADGSALYGGDGSSFTKTDLVALLPAETRAEIEAERARISQEAGADATFAMAFLNGFLNPSMIYTLAGGRLGVLTGASAYTLPITSSQSATVYSVLPTSTGSLVQGLAAGQSRDGGLIYMPLSGSLLALLSSSGTKTFDDPYTVPMRVLSEPAEKTVTDGTALYALDYSSTSTILWTMTQSDWVAYVIAASGTLPNDTTVQIEPDGAGNVWARMKQRGLLRVSAPKRL